MIKYISSQFCFQGEKMLTVIIGPSGVGKNSVIDVLMKKYPNLQYLKAVTTRAKREGERDAYIHVSKKEFEKMIKDDVFFEYENVHADLMYGTRRSALEQIKATKRNYIKDLDVNGAIKVQNYLGKKNCKTVFLDAPNSVLYKRLHDRGESEEMIKVRMSRYEMERKNIDKFDFYIENIDLEDTVKQIEKAVGVKNLK